MTRPSPEPDAVESEGSTSAEAAAATADKDAHIEGPPAAPIPSYVFDTAHVPVASSILDKVFTDLHDGPVGWGLVEDAVADYDDLDPSLKRELSLIGSRSLRLAGLGETGCEFLLDGEWLPDPRLVSSDVVDLWVKCSRAVSSPGARARLEELLIARHEGNVGQRARAAASNYLASISDKSHDLSATIHLARAWTIARRYNAADVEDEVLDEILARVDLISPVHPGSLLPLVAILCRQPTNIARIDALRVDAERVLTGIAQVMTQSHLAAEVAELRLSLVRQGPEAEAVRVQIRRDQLAALRLATRNRNIHPAVRQQHLATAAEFATRHNFKSELKQLRAELEAIDVKDLGLVRFSHSAAIPPHTAESEMHPFTRGHLWQEALGYFLHTAPPTGNVDRLRADASTDHGLLSIFPTQILGHAGLPRVALSSEDEEVTHRMSQQSKVVAEAIGGWHAEGLSRLADRYGVPNQEELRTYFIEQYGCDPGGAHILATAYRQFWNGELIEAVHLVIPAAEAAARRLLRELDEGTYQVAVGNSVGQYPGLRVLLTELDELVLDQSWSWFLKWIFLGPLGMNLRNDVAHGFVAGIDPTYTTLVLRAASLLITTSTTVEGENRLISVPAPPEPRPGMRGVGDRLLRTASNVLLRRHLRLEAFMRGRCTRS